uniref:CHXC29 n=1 Tax=Albugo laibachii Nc14 TaxID=890382 RepID=F0WW75_9STRA|nr:CHXC29 [Albugo laibachii Nc14]|eukprot:CCA25694.1 CHXC29 [Albugo laibachii Nc14]
MNMFRWLCFCLFNAMVSTDNNLQASYLPTLSGILNVTASRRRLLSLCHQCLINLVGITRIELLQATREIRLYWVDGHTDIIRSFVTHCNNIETCFISADSIKAYTPDYLTQSAFQHLKSVEEPTEVEYSTHLLTKYMSNAELRAEAAEWSTNPRRQILAMSSFKRKQVLSIPLFFGSDAPCKFGKAVDVVSEQQPEVHHSSLPPAVVPNIGSGKQSTTQRQQDVRSSLRCMIIPAFKEDAVCREMPGYAQWCFSRSYILPFFQNSNTFSRAVRFCKQLRNFRHY